MKALTRRMFEKASRAIRASELLLREELDPETSISRAYYAMFYVAEALLNERGLRFRKHGGVHAAFGEHFAKTKTLDPKYHRWLLEAFNKRVSADYGVEALLTIEDAKVVIHQAREFLDAAQHCLGRQR